jgi:hypothetical protein
VDLICLEKVILRSLIGERLKDNVIVAEEIFAIVEEGFGVDAEDIVARADAVGKVCGAQSIIQEVRSVPR